MHIYRCNLTLYDYLFFATTERGKIAETGRFIHNYALTYALGWASSPYFNERQQPHYREELSAARGVYVTPAQFLGGGYLLTQYNTMPETFDLSRAQSIGYPNWGFIKCLKPDSRFRFYVLSQGERAFPRFVRLGKFMSKAKLMTQHTVGTRRRGKCQVEPLLNWEDLLAPKPVPRDIIVNALPTRLVGCSAFSMVDYVEADFDGDSVCLPLTMGYLGDAPCNSW